MGKPTHAHTRSGIRSYAERNSLIRHSNTCYYRIEPISKKQIALGGFHDIIQRTFARNSDIFRTMYNLHRKLVTQGVIQRYVAASSDTSHATRLELCPPIAGTSRGYGPSFSTNRGIAIHSQLEDWVLLTRKQFHRKHSDVEPWMLSILNKIETHPDKWVPVLPEFKIFDEEGELGPGST